jgi:spore coat protein U-like protein
MHRWAKVSTAVVAACIVAASTASAQSANINVTANVFQAIAVNGFRALDFGNVFPGVNKTIANNAATSGRFDATGQVSANVNMTFTLPTDLVSGGGANLPIGSWTGCWDADSDPNTGCTGFTPSASASAASFSGTGTLFVFIGGTVSPGASQAAGAYTATATLTLAYF